MPPVTGLSISASIACENGGNVLYLYLSDGMNHPVGGEPMYSFTVLVNDGQPIYGPVGTAKEYAFTGLPNGTYEAWAEATDGRQSAMVIRQGSCVTVPPEPVCDLFLTAPSAQGPSSAGWNDGSITVTPTGTKPDIQIRATRVGQAEGPWVAGAVNGVPFTIPSLVAGDYYITARDGGGCFSPTLTVNVPAFAKAGCTDPTATNYDPEATANDGTCTYAPKPVIPFFDVPIMNSLRFVTTGPAPDYRTTFPTPDNTLQCDRTLRGVKNVGYEQKVDKLDALTIQFRSNYTGHTCTVRDYITEEVYGTFTPEKRIANTSKSMLFTTLLKAHTVEGKTRVYFEQAMFDFDIATDQVLIISNAGAYDGQYTITGIGQDTATSNPYFIINKPFAGPGVSVGASVYAEYDVFPFDVFEVTIDFTSIPAGTVYAVITGTDARPEFVTDAEAKSEPINLQPHHEGTCLIKYRNLDNWADIDYSTGIYHLLRVEANLYQPKPGGEREIHRNSNGGIVKLYAQKHRVFKFNTYMLPEWLHEKLGVVFDYDTVYINGIKVQTEDDYEPEYIDRYSLANGSVDVQQVQWFGNTNNSHDLGDIDAAGGRIIVNGGFLKY